MFAEIIICGMAMDVQVFHIRTKIILDDNRVLRKQPPRRCQLANRCHHKDYKKMFQSKSHVRFAVKVRGSTMQVLYLYACKQVNVTLPERLLQQSKLFNSPS
ncbi:hypothetical protein ACOSQ2_017822 [Xanthoceras sorbifolium]